MPSRINLHPRLRIAAEFCRTAAGMSNCSRADIGCVLLNEAESIIAYAANGSDYPRGCQRPQEMGNCGCLHAEVRAALHCKERPFFAIVSISPCERCAKVLAELGVREVLYFEPSRVHREGAYVLERAGIALYSITVLEDEG